MKDQDIKHWLETLDNETLSKIIGNERVIFATLTQKIKFSSSKPSNFIESVDPATGVRAVIPDLSEPAELPEIRY